MTNTPPPFAQALDEHVKRAYERGREEDWAGLPSASTSAVDEAKQAITAAYTTALNEAKKQTASDILNLANEYANNDPSMRGSEPIKAHHYFNAIHKIGEFDGR